MGIKLRKRRGDRESPSSATNSRRSSSDTSPLVAVATDQSTSAVRVRAKSICNSTNLDQLHLERRQLTASISCTSIPSLAGTASRSLDEDPWSEKNVQAAIDLWELTDEQVDRLKELQLNLKDCSHHFKYDPHIILRYMTSPLGHDAEPLFRKMVQWREDNNIDNMLHEYNPPQILLDYNTAAILKDYDREGDPIYVERGGATDGHGFLKRFTRDELMEFMIYTRELNTQGYWIDEYERRQGRKVRDVTVVYDLKGLNSHHLSPQVLQFFKDVQSMNQERYPGPIKRMIIIRAPAIFRVCWNVVKHFFPPSSRKKMIFAGKHYHKDLEKYIDLEVLPPCIWEGGKGEPAPGLPRRIVGGPIPDHVRRDDQPQTTIVSTPPPPTKPLQTNDSFEGTEQGSLASRAESDTSDMATSF
ncbi:SEC14-like protein 2 [Seminavis robusta]|uniref:SEC14-like protein 2 n=1 Tax=Seminavis robusta TaxID=568900 RepID=A0A9N8EZS5_9STRA|nr:SEC14-like protein 2 [Seminavis robusta]|eukprot:Sro3224_g345570.1 SEC14-like protein 2 (415) ;mRNA; f:5589-6924